MEKRESAKILLIDDDEVTNMINTKLIEKTFRYEVKAYTNASEALAELKDVNSALSESLPDVIFLDINMPEMDGWEFLAAFERLNIDLSRKCLVFMLTSSIDTDDIDRSKKYRCVKDFISKPLTVEKLKSVISVLPSAFTTGAEQ